MSEPERQTFYREVHVDDPGLAARRFFATNLRHRCPACGRSNVTASAFGVKERCPACGSRFDRMEGNELVSIPLGFFVASLLTLLAGTLLVLRYGFFDGLMPVLLALAGFLILVLLRPMRVLTLWMLWLFGFVYPDRLREKGRRELPVEPSPASRAA